MNEGDAIIFKARAANALVILLRAIDRHEKKLERERASGSRIVAFKISKFEELEEDVKQSRDLMDDPIGQSLRGGVRDIGRALARNGITGDEMLKIAQQSAGKRYFYTRIDIIDKWWDGLKMADGDIWTA